MISHGKCHSFFFCITKHIFYLYSAVPRMTQQTKPPDHVRNTYKKQPATNQRITNALYLQQFTSWQQLAQGEYYCSDEQNLKLAPAFNDRKNAENLIFYIYKLFGRCNHASAHVNTSTDTGQ